MGEAPLQLGQLFSPRGEGSHKKPRNAGFLMESFHPMEKYDVLMNTTSNMKVVL